MHYNEVKHSWNPALEMLRLEILLEALCTVLSRLVFRFNRCVCGMDTPNPGIQMTVKTFQILPPIYKIITLTTVTEHFPLFVVIPPAALLFVQES